MPRRPYGTLKLTLFGSVLVLGGCDKGAGNVPNAGCYTISLGPWSAPISAVPSGARIPDRVRLDATPTGDPFWGDQWRRVEPVIRSLTKYRSITPAWKQQTADSIRVYWTTGFVGFELSLKVDGDSLVGLATQFTDTPSTTPVADVKLKRGGCP